MTWDATVLRVLLSKKHAIFFQCFVLKTWIIKRITFNILIRELTLIELNSLCSCIMATRKSIRQSNTRKRPYERPVHESDPDSWPKEKLITKLKDIGIEVPSNLSKNVLIQLFMQNNKSNRTETRVNVPTADNGHSGQNMLVENVNDLSTLRPAISSENSNDTMSNVLNAVASLAKSYSGLQDTVNHLLKSKQTQKIYDTGREGFTLQQWYSSDVVNSASVTNFPVSENCTATANQNPEISQGVRSDSYSNIDIISPSLERQILEGKDVNLASLLIPNYECPQTHTITTNSLEVNVPGKPDVRLNRALTIQEFIKAFGKYKRVMSAVYPARREELDAYAEDIVDISNFYGPKFYDYHKMFSAKAAALLTKLKRKVEWSKRDRDILSLIAAGVKVNVCKLCSMSDHTT